MKQIIHIILTLTIIGVIAGGVLSKVNTWSAPLIKQNQKSETERAIFLVQPTGKSYEPVKEAGFELYKVFDDKKNVIGYSMVYEGNGFQGKIRLMVGLMTSLSEITSLEVLEQTETPGLGTKVTEDPFRKQFNGLQTDPQINWVKGVPASAPNEIQTITGATISSKSITAIVNAGITKVKTLKKEGKL